MSFKLHNQYIHLLSEQLRALSKMQGDNELITEFAKNDFLLRLNFKLFSQIAHFLISILDSNMSKKLVPCAVTPKEKDAFIKELLLSVTAINRCYPWANIPSYQKSHFSDPRSESDKVMDFLLGLSTAASLVATDSVNTTDQNLLEKELNSIEASIADIRGATLLLQDKTKAVTEANVVRPIKLQKEKLKLVEEGIVEREEEANLKSLLQVKQYFDRELLETTRKLQKTALEAFQ